MSREKHDPLCGQYCPYPDLSYVHPGASLPKCRGGDCTLCDELSCSCELIERVRIEALERAAVEVEEYAVARIEHLTHPHDPGFDIAAALRVAAKRVRRLAYA